MVPSALRATPWEVGMLRRWAPLVLLLTCAACGESTVNAPASTAVPACATDEAPGTVHVFAPHVGASEGIAFLNGRLYIAGGDGVRIVGTDGSATMLAAIPATVGMVAWHDALYVAGGTDGTVPDMFCSPTNHGVIWKVTTDGQSSIFARGFISPNFLVVTPWNTLLLADDCPTNKIIYEVDGQGNTSTWN